MVRRIGISLAAVAALLIGLLTTVTAAQAATPPPIAFVPSLLASKVSAINLVTGATTQIDVSYPFGTAVSADRSRVYVTSLFGGAGDGSDSVAVINPATRTVLRTISLGGGFMAAQPNGVAVNSKNTKAYVALSVRDALAVIDLATDTVTEIPVGDNPIGVVVAPGDREVYVSNKNSGTVSVVDTVTRAVTRTITVGTDPAGIDLNPPAMRLFVANTGSGTVSVINMSTKAVVRTIDLPAGASPEAVSFRGGKVAVSNVGVGGVTVIDAGTYRITRTFAVDGTWGIDQGPGGVIVAGLPADDAVVRIVPTSPPTTTVLPTGAGPDSLPLGLGHFIVG